MVQFKADALKNKRIINIVSIPKWCNSKLVLHLGGDFINGVSIPKWCNSKYANYEQGIKKYNVSIPKWCNSKKSTSGIASGSRTFQFQNGAIQSFRSAIEGLSLAMFQFQNGAIQSILKIQPISR